MYSRFPFLSSVIKLAASIFSKKPEAVPHHHFSLLDVSAYFEAEVRQQRIRSVDDFTWDDLDMDEYAESLTTDTSIFGRQMLYCRLRGSQKEEQITFNTRRILSLLAEENLRTELHKILDPLRRADTEIGSLFSSFTPHLSVLGSHHILILQLSLVLSIVGMLFSPYALAGIIGTIFISMALQVKFHRTITNWTAKIRSVQRMLTVASDLAVHAARHKNESTSEFLNLSFGPKKISRAVDSSSSSAAVLGFGEYLDWFLSENIRKYLKSIKAYRLHARSIEDCFLKVSALEADLTVSQHLEKQSQFCLATRSSELIVDFDRVVHPMLSRAIPVSLKLDATSAFISGKNGIGKSTFLRTIGLNLLVANSLGFCYARSAIVSTRPVYTSIRNEDSLEEGHSLYTSELVRARQLLDACSTQEGVICLIDEIFRGTNHVESVSAAASVLHTMTEQSLVIVSSHNLVLAPLLKNSFKPLCLERNESQDFVVVRDGLLIEPNGIRLLEVYGFGSDIVRRARVVANWFNTYLAEPDGYPDLKCSTSIPSNFREKPILIKSM